MLNLMNSMPRTLQIPAGRPRTSRNQPHTPSECKQLSRPLHFIFSPTPPAALFAVTSIHPPFAVQR